MFKVKRELTKEQVECRDLTCRDIVQIVEEVYKFKITGRMRDRPSAEARFVAAKACKEYAVDWHEVNFAKSVNRHRTSVIYYIKQIEDIWHLPTFRDHREAYSEIVKKIRTAMFSKKPPAFNRRLTNLIKS